MFNVFKRKSRSTSISIPVKNSTPSYEVAGNNHSVRTLSIQFGSEEKLPKYGQNVQFKSFRAEEVDVNNQEKDEHHQNGRLQSTHDNAALPQVPSTGRHGHQKSPPPPRPVLSPEARLDILLRKNANKTVAPARNSTPPSLAKRSAPAPPPPRRISSLYPEDTEESSHDEEGVDFALIPPPPSFGNLATLMRESSDSESWDLHEPAPDVTLLQPPPSFDSPSPSKGSTCSSSDSGVVVRSDNNAENSSDSERNGQREKHKVKPKIPDKPSHLSRLSLHISDESDVNSSPSAGQTVESTRSTASEAESDALSELGVSKSASTDKNTKATSEFIDPPKASDKVESDVYCSDSAVQSLLDTIRGTDPVVTNSFSSFRPQLHNNSMENINPKSESVKEKTSATCSSSSSSSSLNNTPCPTPPPRKNRTKSQKPATENRNITTSKDASRSSSFDQTSFTEVSSDMESAISSQRCRVTETTSGTNSDNYSDGAHPRSSTPDMERKNLTLPHSQNQSSKVQLNLESSLSDIQPSNDNSDFAIESTTDQDQDQELDNSFTSSLDSQQIVLSGSFLDDSINTLNRSNTVIRRSTPGPDSSRENLILVEDDYAPDVESDSSAALSINPRLTRPSWHSTMSKSWHANLNHIPGGSNGWDLRPASQNSGYMFPGYLGSNLARRESMRSDASESTMTENGWDATPAESWNSWDVLEWCDSSELQDLKQILQEKQEEDPVTGKQLLQMTSRDLVDLGISDEETRKMVLKEINNLKQKPRMSMTTAAPSSTSLRMGKQSTTQRRTLEASKEQLREDLDSLQKLNDQQEQQITSTLQEFEAQQRLADALLGNAFSDYHQPLSVDHKKLSMSADDVLNAGGATRAHSSHPSSLSEYSGLYPPSTSSRVSSEGKRVPLVQWTDKELLEWMKNVGLEKFVPVFREHGITGKDLAEIDMQLLDDLEVTSTEDRELLLSKLYELQHPKRPLLDIRTAPDSGYHSRSTPTTERTSRRGNQSVSTVTASEKRSSPSGSVHSNVSGDRPVIAAKPVIKKRTSQAINQEHSVIPSHQSVSSSTSASPKSHSKTSKRVIRQDGSVDGEPGGKLQSQDSIELLQEIALLHESLSERDGRIEQLQQQNSQLHKQQLDQDTSTKKTVAALQQELREKEDFAVTNMAALQRQLDRARLMQDPEQRVDILKNDLESLTEDIRSTEHTIAQLSHQVVQQPAADINVDELKQQLEEEQLRLETIRQEHSKCIGRLQQAQTVATKLKTPEEPVLYNYLERDLAASPKQLVAIHLPAPPGEGLGFILGRNDSGLPVVRHVEGGSLVHKADCLLEINGHRTLGRNDQTISQYLKDSTAGTAKLLVLRDQQPMRDQETLDELHSLKEDLSLAVMELETVQQENKDLTNEVASQKNVTGELQKSRETLEREVADLKIQVTESESQWQELTSVLSEVKVKSIDGNSPLSKILETKGGSTSRKSQKLDLENGEFDKQGTETRDGLDWLQELVNGDAGDIDKVLAYDEYDERLPLWECLRSAPQEEILQALKDHMLESRQQKAYLDSLLSAVIDAAPQLLQHVDDKVALPGSVALKLHSEEFC